MKKCIHSEDNIIEQYILNQLKEQEEIQFQEHLLNCELCSQKVNSIRNLAKSLKVEKSSSKRWKMVSIAASVALLIGVGGLLLKNNLSNNNDIPLRAIVVSDTLEIKEKQKQIRVESEEKNLTHLEPEKSESYKKEHIDSINPTIILTPKYAKTDSVTDIEGISIKEKDFKVLSPNNVKEVISLNADSTNLFAFEWQDKRGQPAVLLIKRGTNILDEFAIRDKNYILIDLSKYSQYSYIEWVLMVGDSETREQGDIIFKKE